MVVKTKKPSKVGKKSAKKSSKKGKKSAKSSITGTKSEKPEVDILNPYAMRNLYYTAHGAPEALVLRGFGWTGASKKKGKGKKGKGKKKKKKK